MGVKSKKFTLGKEERLKSRKQIEQLFSEGKKFSLGFFRIYYLISGKEKAGLFFGTGVSTKSFKRAVERNRVKRLIREAYRLQKIILQKKITEQEKQVCVFFVYTGKALPEYADVYMNTSKVLDKLFRIINETN